MEKEPKAPDYKKMYLEQKVTALQMEARHFPSIEPLGKLAAAERQLIKLIDRDDLRPLR